MGKKMLAVDLNLCTGCRSCELRCAFKHHQECNPSKSRIRVLKFDSIGVSVPIFCLNCEEAFCLEVCPTKAIRLDPLIGSLVIHEDRCVGCRACVMACPFAGMQVLENRKVVKCDLCGGDPYCVKYCETGAIKYMEVQDAALQKGYPIAKKIIQPFLKGQ